MLQEHQREKPGRFGLVRHELNKGSTQSNRLLAETLA